MLSTRDADDIVKEEKSLSEYEIAIKLLTPGVLEQIAAHLSDEKAINPLNLDNIFFYLADLIEHEEATKRFSSSQTILDELKPQDNDSAAHYIKYLKMAGFTDFEISLFNPSDVKSLVEEADKLYSQDDEAKSHALEIISKSYFQIMSKTDPIVQFKKNLKKLGFNESIDSSEKNLLAKYIMSLCSLSSESDAGLIVFKKLYYRIYAPLFFGKVGERGIDVIKFILNKLQYITDDKKQLLRQYHFNITHDLIKEILFYLDCSYLSYSPADIIEPFKKSLFFEFKNTLTSKLDTEFKEITIDVKNCLNEKNQTYLTRLEKFQLGLKSLIEKIKETDEICTKSQNQKVNFEKDRKQSGDYCQIITDKVEQLLLKIQEVEKQDKDFASASFTAKIKCISKMHDSLILEQKKIYVTFDEDEDFQNEWKDFCREESISLLNLERNLQTEIQHIAITISRVQNEIQKKTQKTIIFKKDMMENEVEKEIKANLEKNWVGLLNNSRLKTNIIQRLEMDISGEIAILKVKMLDSLRESLANQDFSINVSLRNTKIYKLNNELSLMDLIQQINYDYLLEILNPLLQRQVKIIDELTQIENSLGSLKASTPKIFESDDAREEFFPEPFSPVVASGGSSLAFELSETRLLSSSRIDSSFSLAKQLEEANLVATAEASRTIPLSSSVLDFGIELEDDPNDELITLTQNADQLFNELDAIKNQVVSFILEFEKNSLETKSMSSDQYKILEFIKDVIFLVQDQEDLLKSMNSFLKHMKQSEKFKVTVFGIEPIDSPHKTLSKTALTRPQLTLLKDNFLIFALQYVDNNSERFKFLIYLITASFHRTSIDITEDKEAHLKLLNYICDLQEAKKRIIFFINYLIRIFNIHPKSDQRLVRLMDFLNQLMKPEVKNLRDAALLITQDFAKIFTVLEIANQHDYAALISKIDINQLGAEEKILSVIKQFENESKLGFSLARQSDGSLKIQYLTDLARARMIAISAAISYLIHAPERGRLDKNITINNYIQQMLDLDIKKEEDQVSLAKLLTEFFEIAKKWHKIPYGSCSLFFKQTKAEKVADVKEISKELRLL